ncbi:adenylosuccinate synthetase [Metallosphaera hakonensis]|uniref:Adenylosuccinate synthetase n=1 Tax=Metallosphaera hakonensis JCM 8857 = DSM 7519 TaxID=1293036 RepID=A0A2U9ITT8_9CREN|nr:adenylosuccinate synthetase [Metallosphaera hakonensis]AWR99481.1 adenylosuccinate synthetase [Metallosphaera hakonensis JCM 8857 = DSM 7519]
MLDILVGGFYGDEGKGKIASYLGLKGGYSLVVRTGSINAGHTVKYNEKTWKIRILPSAFVNPQVKLALGPGALTSVEQLEKELNDTRSSDRFIMDPHVGIITQKEIEEEREDEYLMKVIGSTGQGVGMSEAKRILRKLKLAKEFRELEKYIADVPETILSSIENEEKVLAEGTQGTYLSLFHGEYPFVTSRNTTSGGVLSEVGVGPKYVKDIIVIFKSFVTRVGEGYLENELPKEKAEELGLIERGTVTGRIRRTAPFNLSLAKKAIRINSATQVAITKLDALFNDAKGVKEYSKLPKEARKWIENLEEELKTPVTIIGTGEDALDTIDLRKEKVGD